ncbi:MAG TPA: ribosome biogenesis GTPase Der [Bacteroidales bacterium]|nr:ribosome biogenesis GTPase Der [Bacteroidales bacterium]
MSNIVAIVGRPNTGKSTLFNRLTESRQAIVDETAGTTRDRHYGKAEWNGVEFSVIDTGGYVNDSDDIFEEEINKQVELAIEEADVILFMVDVITGVSDLDKAVAAILRRSGKKVFLTANKVDNYGLVSQSYEFYSLGLGDIYCISAMSGSGTGDLLDAIVGSFTKETKDEAIDLPKFTIVGKPNVGKSSLINALIGQDRSIVTPIAGTTRDSIFVRYNKFNHDFYIVDTAGLRKKNKVKEDIEFYSVMRSVRAIEQADVCLLLIDATIGIEAQDMSIFQLCQRNKKGLVIVVNKWDLVEKDNHTTEQYKQVIYNRIAPFTDVPIVFASAVTKQRIHKILETAIEVYQNRTQRISTSKLNEVMLAAIDAYGPPAVKGKLVKIKYVTQLPTPVPSFVFFANLPQYIRDPYKRYLENKLRENFNFSGVPIQIFIRQK